MPIYEYKCEKCGEVSEAIRPLTMADDPLECACGGGTKRIPSVTGRPDFKGEGWTPIEYPGRQD